MAVPTVLLSDWHMLNPNGIEDVPKAVAPVQVPFDNGQMEEGASRNVLPGSQAAP